MATPCTESPTPEDVQHIKESIQKQKEEQERRERRCRSITVKGREIQAGELNYRIIDDPQEIQKAIQKHKEDHRERKEQRREAHGKTLRELSGEISKDKRTGYTRRAPIVTPLLPTIEREIHYDNWDRKIGETVFTTDRLGNPVQVHYDSEDRKIGETRKGTDRWGQERAEHFDPEDRMIGYSIDDTDSQGRSIQKHYNTAGKRVGTTLRTVDRWGKPRKEHQGFYFKSLLISRQEEREAQKREEQEARRRESIGSRFQGDIGELEATRIAMHALGLEALPFDKPRTDHGIDGVFRNPKNGRLVIMEAKLTQEASGFGRESLDYTNHGRQMSVQWLEAKAREMRDRNIGSDLWTGENAEIGREIERVGAKNVERLLIHIHPQSLNVTVSRPTSGGSWEPTLMFQPTMFDEN